MDPSHRHRQVIGIGSVLNSLLEQRGMEEKLRRYRAWQLWDRVVGPQIAARARPFKLRDNVLEIRVDHPVWMQQLQLMKPRILQRLNSALGESLIRDIYLRHGRPRQAPPPAVSELPTLGWQQAQLSADEEDQIARTVAPLADPQLRQRLTELFRRQAQVNKARRECSEN